MDTFEVESCMRGQNLHNYQNQKFDNSPNLKPRKISRYTMYGKGPLTKN